MTAIDLPMDAAQTMLLDSVRRFLTDNPRPGWRQLVDTLGLGGVAVAERAGGFGGGARDIALVMTELGPALAGADWLSHAVAAMLLSRVDPGHAMLPGLAAGEWRAAIVCPASTAAMPIVEQGEAGWIVRGAASLVAGGAEAELLVVADAKALFAFAADHRRIEQRHRIMHDGSATSDILLSPGAGEVTPLATGADAAALAELANDMMLVGRCAEAAGLMQRMIADSVDYMGQRRQFGTPIGSFQVLRHRIADMQLARMKATALTELAVLALDEGGDRGAAVAAACVEVRDAVRIVGEGAVQLHGAMGLTDELALGRHFKRALAIAAGLGPQAWHLRRFAEAAA